MPISGRPEGRRIVSVPTAGPVMGDQFLCPWRARTLAVQEEHRVQEAILSCDECNGLSAMPSAVD
jgi:hypothetical protein